MIILPFALFGCSLIAGLSKGEFAAVAEESRGKDPSGDLLIPVANYSTEKGKYLGERYNRNLEHLLAQIVQDRVTRSLQFADTTLSIKSIGFFTHSASKSLDERYLEVILWVPDVFDDKIDLSVKLDRLFSQYGPALLDILSSDSEIYNEKRVTGFGLNFSWRTTSGSRITLERAVVYLSKDEVKKFLIEKTSVQDLLTGAVIFSTHGGRSGRVQYSRAATKPELKPHATSPPVGKVEKAEIKEADIISLAPVKREEDQQAASSSVHPEGSERRRQPDKRTNEEKERLKPPVLRGYILQLSFQSMAEAERWSDLWKLQGYSTSISLVEGSEPFRLRVGSFSSFTAAAKFFAPLRKENLTGLLLLIP